MTSMKPADEPNRAHNPPVLLVDDDLELCELLAIRLEAAGYHVSVEHDVSGALVARRARARRRGAARPAARQRRRLRGARRRRQALARRAGDHPHGARHDRSRGRGDAEGGLRLRHQAVSRSRPAAEAQAHASRATGSAARSPACVASSAVAEDDAAPRRRQRGDRAGARADRARRPDATRRSSSSASRARARSSSRARFMRSRRGATGRFVAVNCAGLSPELLESTLFGHRRGAFTGAVSDREGLFGAARRGHALPRRDRRDAARRAGQAAARAPGAALHRASARRSSKRPTCASSRRRTATFAQEVAEKRFREDLFYRLHVVPLAMPPLRERREDIVLLAEMFLERAAARARRAPSPRLGGARARRAGRAFVAGQRARARERDGGRGAAVPRTARSISSTCPGIGIGGDRRRTRDGGPRRARGASALPSMRQPTARRRRPFAKRVTRSSAPTSTWSSSDRTAT